METGSPGACLGRPRVVLSQSSILGGKIRKPGISNSMTYRHQNSRKSNFATELPEVRALGMLTRTAVLRLAIARGLRDLECQYQRPMPADASAPRPATTPHDATPGSREGTLSHGYAGRNGEAQASASHRDW
jgi:hypothetical protein